MWRPLRLEPAPHRKPGHGRRTPRRGRGRRRRREGRTRRGRGRRERGARSGSRRGRSEGRPGRRSRCGGLPRQRGRQGRRPTVRIGMRRPSQPGQRRHGPLRHGGTTRHPGCPGTAGHAGSAVRPGTAVHTGSPRPGTGRPRSAGVLGRPRPLPRGRTPRGVLRVPGGRGVVDGELARHLRCGLRVGLVIAGCRPAPADPVPIAAHSVPPGVVEHPHAVLGRPLLVVRSRLRRIKGRSRSSAPQAPPPSPLGRRRLPRALTARPLPA